MERLAAATVPDTLALQPVPPDADAEKLAALEARLTQRSGELDAFKLELQELQSRYLLEIGAFYRELAAIEADVIELEVRAGLRPPPEESVATDPADGNPQGDEDVACGSHAAPTDVLKRMFRDVAKSIHPDLAMDEAARFRRHSLMAEANRAYAERDADRLLLILRKWECSPESVAGDDPEAQRLRAQRRATEIEQQLAAIDREFIELRNSAIARLNNKIDETRRQGWDLFAEMVAQVRTDIARAKARLLAAQRMVGIRTSPGTLR